jgi:hypothetical protein
MADPISLVGLTAGLVSLGLQASGGIVKYLDTLECREEDIASVRQQNASLAQILLVVEEAISQIQPKHQASTAAVHASLDICKRQLNALNALVVKLAGPDQSTPRTGTPVARVKRHGTKLFYPFRRQKIEQLAARLCEANTALQLALQALSMYRTLRPFPFIWYDYLWFDMWQDYDALRRVDFLHHLLRSCYLAIHGHRNEHAATKPPCRSPRCTNTA